MTSNIKQIKTDNQIYSALVTKETGLAGMIAFDHYKQALMDIIDKYETVNGVDPTKSFINDFHEKSMDKLEDYRERGRKTYKEMIAIAIEKAVQEDPDMIRNAAKKVTEPENKSKTKKERHFLKTVLANVTARAIWVILPLVLILLFNWFFPETTIKFLSIFHPQYIEIINGLDNNTSDTLPAPNFVPNDSLN